MADRKLLAWFKREEIMSADQRQILEDYYKVRSYTAQDSEFGRVGVLPVTCMLAHLWVSVWGHCP